LSYRGMYMIIPVSIGFTIEFNWIEFTGGLIDSHRAWYD
jgi:hypothetical protein